MHSCSEITLLPAPAQTGKPSAGITWWSGGETLLPRVWAGKVTWEQKYPQAAAQDLEQAITSASPARLVPIERAENIPSLHVGGHNALIIRVTVLKSVARRSKASYCSPIP